MHGCEYDNGWGRTICEGSSVAALPPHAAEVFGRARPASNRQRGGGL